MNWKIIAKSLGHKGTLRTRILAVLGILLIFPHSCPHSGANR